MSENKKKRYPTDRLKLHALYVKKKQELAEMQAEVDKIGELAQQADDAAILAAAERYHVSADEMEKLMQSVYGDRVQEMVPETPDNTGSNRAKKKKEDFVQDEQA